MPVTATIDLDLDLEENRHHRHRHADRSGWRLMPTLRRGSGPVEVYLLEPYDMERTLVIDRPDDPTDAWMVEGVEVVPLAWRDATVLHDLDEAPDLAWFDDEPDVAFWTLCPFEVSRVCYSPAEGGCWADVGKPTELQDCPPEIYRTSAEAYAARHRMARRLDRLNREEGLRDLSSVLGTYQYRAEVRSGLPRPDRIPTYE